MNHCVKYQKGHDLASFAAVVNNILDENNTVSIEAQPGDATRYFLILTRTQIPVCGRESQYVLSYAGQFESLCIQLGPYVDILVPEYIIEKCPTINPHTACFLAGLLNVIFSNDQDTFFDFQTGRSVPRRATS